MEEFALDGVVDDLFDLHLTLEHVVDGEAGDVGAGETDEAAVDGLGGLMEDVAKDAVVDEVLVVVVGLDEVADIVVEEAELTAEVGADGRGTDTAFSGREPLAEDVDDGRGLGDGLWRAEDGLLAGLQGLSDDGALDHELEHEARHLAGLSVVGGVVVEDGDIAGALEQAVEVVLIDGDLVIDGGEPVGLADGVRDERGVVDAAGHVALVAGEEQHVVEVEVAGLEDSHHLYALGRFAVEGDGGGLYELGDESLEGDDVDFQDTAVDEVGEAVEEGVHSEAGL